MLCSVQKKLVAIRLMKQATAEDPDEGELDPLERVGNPLKALALIERFIGTWEEALNQTQASYNTLESRPDISDLLVLSNLI